jgi:hypothetical protein
MNRLEINKQFFSRGGIIGRWDFFIKSAESLGLYALGFIVFVLGVSMGKGPAIIGSVTGFGIVAISTVFYWFNAFKRLRDIRGTAIQETPYQVGLFFASIIPYLNLIPFLCLLCMQGQSASFIQAEIGGQNSSESEISNDLAA